MFTTLQASRMVTAANSGTAGRSNLWTAGNLTATGTTSIVVPNCAPVADFHANRYTFCAGSSATFYDNSWNANVTSRLWTFTDGINTITDTSAIPVITFTNAGIYNVTLMVTSAGGSDSETRNSYIFVYDVTAEVPTAPFIEDFESNPISSGLWSVLYNPDPVNGWQITHSASVSPNTSIMVHNYALGGGQIHSIVSPSYDFTTTDVRNYSAGSHELMLGYDFGYDIMKMKTPRYF
jgi:PKD repeat protein